MECCGRGLPGKRWLLEGTVVTVGWSHHHPTKPSLAAGWFSPISDDIFHGAELTSVRRKNICSHALGPGRLGSVGGNQKRHLVIIITQGVWGSCYVCNVCGLGLDPAGSEVALQDPYLVLASSTACAVPRRALGRQSLFFSNVSGGKTLLRRKKSSVEKKYQEKEMWLLILKAGGSSRKGIRTWKDFT